ncbi:hypothetical protein DL766_008368 [Monosporascus sp. MC13-8B]|uniref:Cryptochrome/DNA photolyase FAD-binding domain-containing protein n=1 Tax=Monosporascus cannonballus TaxID=155416 RepID=A0ABY0H4B6_9PEZI|nr:hypothetical protein DL763_011329 [Monosporascus cannonballus]RYO84512.1 hypothetical protein DL762_005618 [Monosporascus cannonballus]RYP19726.1 hypothetical protein DL766_008368 [Monosporascus sp. MC13-8B]
MCFTGSGARTRLLRAELAALGTPARDADGGGPGRNKGRAIAESARGNNVGHVFANIEYEIEEPRRDPDLFKPLEREEETDVRHMRQTNTEAYMHNRLRMDVASYPPTNLLIDYLRGERYFAEHLVDWGLCTNTQGWEPSYTVFSPVTQPEKYDPNEYYIRRRVREPRGVVGNALFDPYNRPSRNEFEKLGYPKLRDDFKERKDKVHPEIQAGYGGCKL